MIVVLSDSEIWKLISKGDLAVDPILRGAIEGAKIDLRLDNLFDILQEDKVEVFDPAEEPSDGRPRYVQREVSHTRPFILHPGNFVIGRTFESVRLPSFLFGRLDGRSSLARQGLLVHATAPGIDPGFGGVIALELHNVGKVPIALRPMMRVAALTLERIEGTVRKPYAGKFGSFEAQIQWKADADLQDLVKRLSRY